MRLTPLVRRVLILVLVDVGLRLREREDFTGLRPGLNPCFSGCWSRTVLRAWTGILHHQRVLILVLVDVGLGRKRSGLDETVTRSS